MERGLVKVQCIRCLTCNHIYAVCVEEYIDTKWLKKCSSALKTGNSKIETMTIDELGDQFGYSIEKCCGRKAKLTS